MTSNVHKWRLHKDYRQEKGSAMGYCPKCNKVVKMRKNGDIKSIRDQRYICLICGVNNEN